MRNLIGVLVTFHLLANATMIEYWGGGLMGFLTAQYMGIPFFLDHLIKLGVAYAIINITISVIKYISSSRKDSLGRRFR